MVSIKNSLLELDTAVGSYKTLISDLAQYTAGLDNENTAAVRSSLEGIALSVKDAQVPELPQFNVRIRTLLQEYGKRVTTYVANLQQERVRTERVLRELASSLTHVDDDHDGRIRKTVNTLRTLSRSPDAKGIREMLTSAAASIEQSMDKLRREHQDTIIQFNTEIRALQRRLDTSEEKEESTDNTPRVYTRAEIEEKMTSAQPGQYVMVMIRARGLRRAEVEQSASAFTSKMRDILPAGTAIAKWADEAFVGVVPTASAPSSSALCRTVAERLPGAYACNVTVCAVDGNSPAQVPERVEAALARI